MEELVGRLTTLDPDASASLKVIVYFDSLVDGHAGIEAFLRGAAILTGSAAGVVYPGRRIKMRVDETGNRTATSGLAADHPWPAQSLGYADDAWVWIERMGTPHANDAMVLERLAWGLRMTIERSESAIPVDRGAGVEILLDASALPGERHRAGVRLHLADTDTARVVAVPPDDAPSSARSLSTVMPTPVGPVKAIVEVASARRPAVPPPPRAGVGPWVQVRELPESWRAAVVALRLTGASTPVLMADELGPLLVLAAGVDAQPGPIPEVELLDSVTSTWPWAASTLEALSAHDSVRAAAQELNVHHSTVQARCEQLEDVVGFSLRNQAGRTRIALGLRLQRLVHNRFG